MAFVKKLLNSNRCIWIVFGNNEDPEVPLLYKSNSKMWIRELYWFFLRNPLHNFSWRVLGIADKQFISIGKYPNTVFNPNGGWNWAIRKYKWLSLPFISYIGKIKFYAGWRERGNVGVKFTLNSKK